MVRQQKGIEITEAEAQEMYDEKSRIFHSMPEAPIMPGILSLMEQIDAAGISIGVVTGSGQRPLIARILRDFGRFVSPEHITTAYDVPRGKPHPDPYLIGMKKAGGLSSSEAIVVENAPLGVRAGIAAGCYTIAVNTGPLPDQVLLDAGASILFPSMPALSDAWKELLSKI
jgi:HAD superfamily hydrolase (TIGR01509 family)